MCFESIAYALRFLFFFIIQVKVLYVRNLMLSTSEEVIEKYFNDLIPNSVERVKKIRDYAFVHFNTRENAVIAMELSNGKRAI